HRDPEREVAHGKPFFVLDPDRHVWPAVAPALPFGEIDLEVNLQLELFTPRRPSSRGIGGIGLCGRFLIVSSGQCHLNRGASLVTAPSIALCDPALAIDDQTLGVWNGVDQTQALLGR